MTTPVKVSIKHVKPILSLSHEEARRRVLKLYKTWYRQIPYLIDNYEFPKSEEQCRKKLREQFKRHADISDIRVIDMLYIKGQMELQEAVNLWKPSATLLNYWNETRPPKPKDFMSKFIAGHE